MRKTYERNWIIYGQCSRCGEYFEMSNEFWYSNKSWFMWFSTECKKCDNERRLRLSHIRPKNYEASRIASKKYYEKNKKEIQQKNHARGKLKWYDKIHRSTKKKIDRRWIRPSSCPICWANGVRIIAHHPDYNDRNLIVFCCDSCHRNIHNGNIECPKPINILDF